MKYTRELFAELEAFQVRNMGANTVKKAENFEQDFAAWKAKNGFDARADLDDLAVEFRPHLFSTSHETDEERLEKYPPTNLSFDPF